MQTVLYNFITHKIEEASSFVTRFMPINLSADEIYEGLLGNDFEMAQAFANAAKYLPSAGLNRHMNVKTEEWGSLTLNLRLSPTDKYPVFLMPQMSTDGPYLTRQSKLSKALQLPMRVARDWHMLDHVFRTLASEIEDVSALACLMPWIREHIAQWEKENPRPKPPYKPSKDRRPINRDVNAILSGRAPQRFPRLTEQLNSVCQSGKALFSQYRMLEVSRSNLTVSPVIIGMALWIPDWLATHLAEVLEDWRVEQAIKENSEYLPDINLERRRKYNARLP